MTRTSRSTDELAEAFLTASRALVGLAVQSLGAAPVEITMAQHRVLVLLASRGEQQIGDIAAELRVNPSNATRHCDRLQKLGLLARQRSTIDGRVVQVALDRRRTEGRRRGLRRASRGDRPGARRDARRSALGGARRAGVVLRGRARAGGPGLGHQRLVTPATPSRRSLTPGSPSRRWLTSGTPSRRGVARGGAGWRVRRCVGHRPLCGFGGRRTAAAGRPVGQASNASSPSSESKGFRAANATSAGAIRANMRPACPIGRADKPGSAKSGRIGRRLSAGRRPRPAAGRPRRSRPSRAGRAASASPGRGRRARRWPRSGPGRRPAGRGPRG